MASSCTELDHTMGTGGASKSLTRRLCGTKSHHVSHRSQRLRYRASNSPRFWCAYQRQLSDRSPRSETVFDEMLLLRGSQAVSDQSTLAQSVLDQLSARRPRQSLISQLSHSQSLICQLSHSQSVIR
eukprot:1532993-Rhodomonas_salina.1